MAGFAKSDLMLVRDYVTAQDHLQYVNLPDDIVAILITHSNLTAKHLDIRLNLHLTVLLDWYLNVFKIFDILDRRSERKVTNSHRNSTSISTTDFEKKW